ncbi:transcription factor MYB115-like isoform X2 [Brassica rapa]|uniref:transcription factor MYB115-like isoform X2 n=1 Tax=Brassica campestris TaxID=3711 RepID=UPI00142D26B2|nr:transcription factor MYB115-like isoform X2 [Brassica rapa]
MDYSFNIFNKNFTRNETESSITNDNLAYLQKDHINCFNEYLGQSSVNGWSNSSIMTSNSDSNHQSLMSVMPNQNYNHSDIELPASTKGNFNTGAWDQSEDTNLRKLVELYGTKNWKNIANMLGTRIGKQRRERWQNHLRHDIKKSAWTEEEDRILVEAHKVFGNKWAKIALKLCGRTEKAIKNRWNGLKRRMHQKRMKQSDKNANPPQNVFLARYIRHVTNENESPNTKETDCTKDDDHENAFDGEMDLSLDVTTQTTKPLASMSTTSSYVPEPAMTFSWDDYFTYI